MQMEIKEAAPIEASFKGIQFQVKRPKVLFLRDFKKRMKSAQDGQSQEDIVDILLDFCEKVGVPNEVLQDWGMDEMNQFFSSLGDGEKKT